MVNEQKINIYGKSAGAASPLVKKELPFVFNCLFSK
jgi:hypothetical protein